MNDDLKKIVSGSAGELIAVAAVVAATVAVDMISDRLKEIAEEKGYSEILVIDESKVANYVNVLKAYNLIINKEVDIWLLNNCDYDNYVRIRNQSLINSKVYCDDGAIIDNQLTRDEFNFLKEIQQDE